MTEVDYETEEFKFSELSAQAKDKARNKYREGDYPGYDWWDTAYDDAVRIGAVIGINIGSNQRKSADGKRTYTNTGISFSGFGNQGDGASFEGSYCIAKDGLEKIKAETNDEELIRIAEELSVLQLTRRLNGLEPFSAVVKDTGKYSHSGGMSVDVTAESESYFRDQVDEDLEEAVTQLMRDFADWIYDRLEAEYEYLISDEYVDEYLNDSDNMYDESGAII